MIYFILLLCTIGCASTESSDKLRVFHEWKSLDFEWKSPSQKSEAIDSGNYNSKSCFPFDVDQAPDGRIFVTVVRDAGVPATLTTVSHKMGEGGPLLKPYPNWSWNNMGNGCRGITGVYRVTIVGNLLYVLDTGKSGNDQVCSAKLLIFDLSTDKLIKRVIIPSEYANNKNGTGLLVTPVVDVMGPFLDQANVYMADTEGYGLVVWNGLTNTFKRIESKSFDAASDATKFTIGDNTFDLADGILGMAMITDVFSGFQRYLYYRPLASFYMYHVSLAELNSVKGGKSSIRYVQEPNKLRSQSAAQAFSRGGILFFNSLTDRSLICWNRRRPFNDNNTVQFAINEETLQFPSGLKVVPRGPDEQLLVMTNRYQKIANGNIDFNDVNFRISGGNVRHLVRGTKCEEDVYPTIYKG